MPDVQLKCVRAWGRHLEFRKRDAETTNNTDRHSFLLEPGRRPTCFSGGDDLGQGTVDVIKT